mmetsp:Transcript_10904/g.33426  ORF Transcript_10904/g.33426 Transcript_10904/m.33426 type:complete len:334 (+) Transcript_10904:321-1322(+)
MRRQVGQKLSHQPVQQYKVTLQELIHRCGGIVGAVCRTQEEHLHEVHKHPEGLDLVAQLRQERAGDERLTLKVAHPLAVEQLVGTEQAREGRLQCRIGAQQTNTLHVQLDRVVVRHQCGVLRNLCDQTFVETIFAAALTCAHTSEGRPHSRAMRRFEHSVADHRLGLAWIADHQRLPPVTFLALDASECLVPPQQAQRLCRRGISRLVDGGLSRIWLRRGGYSCGSGRVRTRTRSRSRRRRRRRPSFGLRIGILAENTHFGGDEHLAGGEGSGRRSRLGLGLGLRNRHRHRHRSKSTRSRRTVYTVGEGGLETWLQCRRGCVCTSSTHTLRLS